MKTICARCGVLTIMPFGDVTRNPLCRSCFFKEQTSGDNYELSKADWDAALYELLKEGR